MTPVQAVMGRDEHLPLLNFCKHHLWPKLADHSDWVMKMLRNLIENIRAKIPSGTIRLTPGSKPNVEGQWLQQKDKKRNVGKKEKRKTF